MGPGSTDCRGIDEVIDHGLAVRVSRFDEIEDGWGRKEDHVVWVTGGLPESVFVAQVEVKILSLDMGRVDGEVVEEFVERIGGCG